jgi:hypothetical protein
MPSRLNQPGDPRPAFLGERGCREVGYWVRATSGFQRSDHTWLVTHERVSLPLDIESGRAATDLVPLGTEREERPE